MSLLGQATQVGKAVKNVGRLREIITTMSRFGFGEVVERLGLHGFSNNPITKGADSEEDTFPQRLRMLLEDLGPTFIKIGQILAGRPDLINAEIVTELEKLQDKVEPVPFSNLKAFIETDLDRPLEACFASFDTEPMATASIAQVHAARTLDGEDVVVKIKKPGVDRLLAQDLEIVAMLAALAERYIPELRIFHPSEIVKEFRRTLLSETNFTLEANNTKRFRETFSNQNFLVIPKVFSELSGPRVLTLERLRGVNLSQSEAIKALGVDQRHVLSQGMDCFFQSIMIDGFFHADPHAGNILILPDGRMGLIDFGSVVRLSQKSKDAIINMFLALVTEDFDSLVQEYVDLSPSSEASRSSATLQKLQREIRETMSPYYGLPLKDIPAGKILMQSTNIAFRFQVSIPHDLIMVFKAIMTLEGIGRSLDPGFNLVESATKYAKIVLKQRYSPGRLFSDGWFLVRDIGRLLERAPKQLSMFLRQLEGGQFQMKIEHLGIEKLAKAQLQSSINIGSAILAVGFLLVAAITGQGNHVPFWFEVALWATGICFSIYSFWKIFRS